jgi:hypothetical protein
MPSTSSGRGLAVLEAKLKGYSARLAEAVEVLVKKTELVRLLCLVGVRKGIWIDLDVYGSPGIDVGEVGVG